LTKKQIENQKLRFEIKRIENDLFKNQFKLF